MVTADFTPNKPPKPAAMLGVFHASKLLFLARHILYDGRSNELLHPDLPPMCERGASNKALYDLCDDVCERRFPRKLKPDDLGKIKPPSSDILALGLLYVSVSPVSIDTFEKDLVGIIGLYVKLDLLGYNRRVESSSAMTDFTLYGDIHQSIYESGLIGALSKG